MTHIGILIKTRVLSTSMVKRDQNIGVLMKPRVLGMMMVQRDRNVLEY
jgi:hypothetical protein